MAKRLCKMNRKQIADSLSDIHRLVVEPKFLCRSCARSSADKGSLCKPAAIPPKQCQAMPIEEQKACGLLAEAVFNQSPLNESVVTSQPEISHNNEQIRAEKVRRLVEKVKVEKVKQQSAQKRHTKQLATRVEAVTFDLSDKKAIKQAKKALKKQHKAQKKLIKLAKKQLKLAKKQQRLEQLAAQTPVVTLPQEVVDTASNNLH